MVSNHFALRDVVDLEMLQDIQDRFSYASGLAAFIVDYKGKPVTVGSNFTPFCKLVRSTEEGWQGCEQSDAHAGLEALRSKQPFIYRCHMGLVDLTAPIIVNNQYLGCIMTGQVLAEPENMEELLQIFQPRIDMYQEQRLLEEYKKIAVIPRKKIEAFADLLYTMANYIAEKGITNIIQSQLMEERLKLAEEVKIRAELEKALKEAEVKTLQSQVNPHFLFNTLNTISRLALLEGASQTQETVIALAELLRVGLGKAGRVGTLADEMDYIHNYVLIQQTRFYDRLTVDFDVHEGCLDAEMPLLTLQPLVENAIVHGIEPQESGGHLWIRGYKVGDYVQIEIGDNGLGIAPDVLEEISRQELEQSGCTHVTGLGISNVRKRLQYHFGSEYTWKAESRLGEGTKIAINIPYRSRRAALKNV